MDCLIPFILFFAVSILQGSASSAFAARSPEEIVAGFDKRVEVMFRAESGKPLVRAASSNVEEHRER